MLLKGRTAAAHLERELRAALRALWRRPLLVLEPPTPSAPGPASHVHEREVLTVLPQFDWGQLMAAGGNMSCSATEADRPAHPDRQTGQGRQRRAAAVVPATCRPTTCCSSPCPNSTGAKKAAGSTAGQCRRRHQAQRAAAGRTAQLDRRPPAPPAADVPIWKSLKFIAERVEGNLLAAIRKSRNSPCFTRPGNSACSRCATRAQRRPLRPRRPARSPARRRPRAPDRTLDGLMQEGEAPPLVFWAMSEEIRAWPSSVPARMPAGRSILLLKDAKVWGPRAIAVRNRCQRLNTQRRGSRPAATPGASTAGQGRGQGNVWEAFLRLGLRLCRTATRPALNMCKYANL